MSEGWLEAVLRVRAIAQAGRTYSRDPYDLERFVELGGLAELLIARLADAPPQRIMELFIPERGYPTPKVDVRAGVFRDDCVLLVREASDARWSLPGGWADEQESPRQSVEREVFEESGFVVHADKLVAVKDRSLHDYAPRRLEHIYKLFFLCTLQSGMPAVSLETTGAEFFPLDALPPLSLGRTLEEDVRRLRRHRDEPGLPTYFD